MRLFHLIITLFFVMMNLNITLQIRKWNVISNPPHDTFPKSRNIEYTMA